MSGRLLRAQPLRGAPLLKARLSDVRRRGRAAVMRVQPLSLFVEGYYRAKFSPLVWENVVNRRARRAYSTHPPRLTAFQQEKVQELRGTGITLADVRDVLGGTEAWEAMVREKERLVSEPDIQDQIRHGKSAGLRGKYYVIRVFGERPSLDLANPFVRFALDESLLALVSAYFEMQPRLKSFDLWYNLPVGEGEPAVASQRWHRDYEDERLVKIFLYLEDVDAEMGPFTYIEGTHSRGALGNVFPRRPPLGSCPPEEAVERYFEPGQIRSCTAPAGTLVLCDTTGLHRGGRSTTKGRVLFTATYASLGAVDADNYVARVPVEGLTAAARFAIGARAVPDQRPRA